MLPRADFCAPLALPMQTVLSEAFILLGLVRRLAVPMPTSAALTESRLDWALLGMPFVTILPARSSKADIVVSSTRLARSVGDADFSVDSLALDEDAIICNRFLKSSKLESLVELLFVRIRCCRDASIVVERAVVGS